ncbi:MAG: hypothetical protein RBR35_13520 [Salinivirgaceae bacterium]|nr:hypothetical protein [Salinivirgaceae bacterium]MDY0281566.1 hypothetical protein [Salinivirgaceae bacterium]
MSNYKTDRQYIINQVRKLPVHECFVSADWKESQQVNIFISRKMSGDYYCLAIYFVDLLCLGIIDCHYRVKVDTDDYNKLLNRHIGLEASTDFIKVDYSVVHNIIYEALEYALSFGFQPHKAFALVKYFLQEDTNDIEIIDIPLGYQGSEVPAILASSENPYTRQIQHLRKKLGEGNFHVFYMDLHGQSMDDDYDDDIDDFVFDPNQDPEVISLRGINSEEDKYEHLFTNNSIVEETIKHVLQIKHPNAEKIIALFDEFKISPYSGLEKPFAEDVIYKVYELISTDIQTYPEYAKQFNIWDQSIEIVIDDDQHELETLSLQIMNVFRKIEKTIKTKNPSKILIAMKELDKIADEQKTISYFETLLQFVEESEATMEIVSKEYYAKFPSVHTRLLYLNMLAITFNIHEINILLGNWKCVADVVSSDKLTLTNISDFFKFMIIYHGISNVKYIPEIMKVIKNTPNSLKEDLYNELRIPMLSIMSKIRCLYELSRILIGK